MVSQTDQLDANMNMWSLKNVWLLMLTKPWRNTGPSDFQAAHFANLPYQDLAVVAITLVAGLVVQFIGWCSVPVMLLLSVPVLLPIGALVEWVGFDDIFHLRERMGPKSVLPVLINIVMLPLQMLILLPMLVALSISLVLILLLPVVGAAVGLLFYFNSVGADERSAGLSGACPVCPGRVPILPLSRRWPLLYGVDRGLWDIGGLARLVLAVHKENGLYQRAALIRRQNAGMRAAATEPERAMGALGECHEDISG